MKGHRRGRARKKAALLRVMLYCGILALCFGILTFIHSGGGQHEAHDAFEPSVEIAAPAITEPESVTLPDLRAPATASPTPTPTVEPMIVTPEPTSVPVSAEPTRITITAAGDCTFGGCLKHDTLKVFKRYVDDYGYDYFFDNVRDVFENDDLTIINLEGPLTDVGTMTTKSSICFCGSPEWTAIMSGSSVELCNMANNHSMDMGEEGMRRTAQALDEASIGYCGYKKVFRTTIKGVRVSALGFDKWNSKYSDIVAAVKRERSKCDLLIVNMHWGFEMQYKTQPNQSYLGHAIIDAGADLIIGTHPHVFGGIERYKGKYIAYSLGNFCFGGHTNPSDKRCIMFQQSFVLSPDGTLSDDGINVFPCMVSGDPSTNDFQPYVLDKAEGKQLLKEVARYSNLGKKTLWMQGCYPERMGFIEPRQ